MNTKGVEDGISDEQVLAKQRVLAVYPDATIARDRHSAYYAFTKRGAGGRISEYVGSEELVWRSAASKLPAAPPVFHCACGGAMDYMNTCHSEEECVVEPSTPPAPTFSCQLSAYLTRNGGDAPHMQAKINRFLYDGKWQTTQGGSK